MKISKGLKQAYDLQDLTYQAAIALRDTLVKNGKMVVAREEASAICQIVKAWETCQERVRIHRGKPLPGSLKPEKKAPKAKNQANHWHDPSPPTAIEASSTVTPPEQTTG